MLKNRNAFTLAEVLITLGIIGVVAAMTIPTLMANYQKKQTAIRLKKIYSVFHQAVKLAEAQNEDMSGWDYPETETKDTNIQFYNKYFAEHIKASRVKNDDCKGLPATGLSGRFTCYEYMDGTRFSFSADPGKYIFLRVDLNGNNLPNEQGKDVFGINIWSDGRGVSLTGKYSEVDGKPITDRKKYIEGIPINNGTAYACCSNDCPSSQYKRLACGALIQLDGWEIRNDYPW